MFKKKHAKTPGRFKVYFLVYEESKSLLDPHLPSVASTLWAGGLAGCFALGNLESGSRNVSFKNIGGVGVVLYV